MNRKRKELVIVGCQSGDEGKGKFTDIFSERADYVVRYQGGPNTGHTVNVAGKRFRFIQLPSGLLHGCKGIIGNGCILDPVALKNEINELEAYLGSKLKLSISESAHVIFPYHRAMDQVMEGWRGDRWAVSGDTGFSTGLGQLGSTNRGVGPCREDKIARIGFRMIDLTDERVVRNKLPRIIELKKKLIESITEKRLEQLPFYREEDWDVSHLISAYLDLGRHFENALCDVSFLLEDARKQNARIIHEGAQSVGLDIEHGSYPFCSSGYSAAHGTTVGTGTPLDTPFEVYGVVKAYMSQSGGGPLPTAMDNPAETYVVERGREFGTVTGRRRRVGWLDLPFIRRAICIDGIKYLCISSLDVLAGLPEVRVATHYLIDGKEYNTSPVKLSQLSKVEPEYTLLPGWPEINWNNVVKNGIDALPENAKGYLDFIAQNLNVTIAAFGVGPNRTDTVILRQPELNSDI